MSIVSQSVSQSMVESNGTIIGFAHTICNLPRGVLTGLNPAQPLVSTSVIWYHLIPYGTYIPFMGQYKTVKLLQISVGLLHLLGELVRLASGPPEQTSPSLSMLLLLALVLLDLLLLPLLVPPPV